MTAVIQCGLRLLMTDSCQTKPSH